MDYEYKIYKIYKIYNFITSNESQFLFNDSKNLNNQKNT